MSDDVELAYVVTNSSGFLVLPAGVKNYLMNDSATLPLGTTFTKTLLAVDTSGNGSKTTISMTTPETALKLGGHSIVGNYSLPAGFDCVPAQGQIGNGLAVTGANFVNLSNLSNMSNFGGAQWSIADGFFPLLQVSLTGGRAVVIRASNIPLSATSFNSTTQAGSGTGSGYSFQFGYIGSVANSQTMPSTLDVTVQMSCTYNNVASVGTVAAFSLRLVP